MSVSINECVIHKIYEITKQRKALNQLMEMYKSIAEYRAILSAILKISKENDIAFANKLFNFVKKMLNEVIDNDEGKSNEGDYLKTCDIVKALYNWSDEIMKYKHRDVCEEYDAETNTITIYVYKRKVIRGIEKRWIVKSIKMVVDDDSDDEEDSDECEEIEVEKFVYNGKVYLRDNGNRLYDLNTTEFIGVWNGSKIIFVNE